MTTARAKEGNVVAIGIFDLLPELSAAVGCITILWGSGVYGQFSGRRDR